MTGGRRWELGVAGGPLPRTGAEELAAGSGPAAVRVGDAIVDLVWRSEAEASAWASVQFGCEGRALALGQRG